MWLRRLARVHAAACGVRPRPCIRMHTSAVARTAQCSTDMAAAAATIDYLMLAARFSWVDAHATRSVCMAVSSCLLCLLDTACNCFRNSEFFFLVREHGASLCCRADILPGQSRTQRSISISILIIGASFLTDVH